MKNIYAIAAILCLMTGSLGAAETTIFGPERFAKTKGRDVETRDFLVSDPSVRCSIQITDIDPGTSADVYVNGMLVVEASSFTNAWIINSSAPVTATSTLEINHKGTTGLAFTIVITEPTQVNNPPTAQVSATPTSGSAPLEVAFSSAGSADSDGTIAQYSWDFGDSSGANVANPVHTYASAGEYTSTLTVTDDGGATHSSSVQVSVSGASGNIPPVAQAGATPTSGLAPLAVEFSAAGSSDGDGSIVSYSWDFGDGGSSDAVSPSYSYLSEGDYTATLTVTDDGGAIGTDSVAITVIPEITPQDPIDFVVFGPETFTKASGNNPPEVRSFQVPVPGDHYRLEIPATDSQADVLLNGVQVVAAASDFTGVDLVVPVVLQADNSLSVEQAGKNGRSLTLTVIGSDEQDPTIGATVDPQLNADGWVNSPITVTFSGSDAGSGVASLTDPVVVSSDGAAQVVSGVVTDRVGRTSSLDVTISVDQVAPAITPHPMSPGDPSTSVRPTWSWSVADDLSTATTAVTAMLTTPSGVVDVSADAQVSMLSGEVRFTYTPLEPLANGAHSLEVTGYDAAGNTASAVIPMVVSGAVPLLDQMQVVGGSLTNNATPQLGGRVLSGGAGVDGGSLMFRFGPVGGQLVGLQAGVLLTEVQVDAEYLWSYVPSRPLLPGDYELRVEAADLYGNTAAATVPVTIDRLPPVLQVTGGPRVVVGGGETTYLAQASVDDALALVSINGTSAPIDASGMISMEVAVDPGVTQLSFLATDLAGNTTAVDQQVVVDDRPPSVRITVPGSSYAGDAAALTIVGLVSDRETNEGITVQANGIVGSVSDGLFSIDSVPLAAGMTQLTVEATDGAGNLSTATMAVNPRPATGLNVIVTAGDHQQGPIRSELPAPITVTAIDAGGNPVPNVPLRFEVISGSGAVASPTGTPVPSVTLLSGADGAASVRYILGDEAGALVHVVRVTAQGSQAISYAHASAEATTPSRLVYGSAWERRGSPEQPLQQPLRVQVLDAGSNPVSGAEVTFTVLAGGGSLPGGSTELVPTDAGGYAEVPFTLGSAVGTRAHMVEAQAAGQSLLFQVSAQYGLPEGGAAIQGLVLTTSYEAVVGAEVVLQPGNRLALTDSEGRYQFDQLSIGKYQIIIDPEPATSHPSVALGGVTSYFEVMSGDGLQRVESVRLPVLDQSTAKTVGSTDDTIEVASMVGSALAINGGSVRDTLGQVTTANLFASPLSASALPSAPPRGNGFGFTHIGSLSGDVSFETMVTLPNHLGLAAGEVADLVVYDSASQGYQLIGFGMVSADASTIRSEDLVLLTSGAVVGFLPNQDGFASVVGRGQSVIVREYRYAGENLDQAAEREFKIVQKQVATPIIALDETATVVVDDEYIRLVGRVLSPMDMVAAGAGAVTPPSEVLVVVDGQEVAVDINGYFSHDHFLLGPDQIVSVTAYNVLGGFATDHVRVIDTAVGHRSGTAEAAIWHEFVASLPEGLEAIGDMEIAVLSSGEVVRSITVPYHLNDREAVTEPVLVSHLDPTHEPTELAKLGSARVLYLTDLAEDLRFTLNGTEIGTLEQQGIEILPVRDGTTDFAPGAIIQVPATGSDFMTEGTIQVRYRGVETSAVRGFIGLANGESLELPWTEKYVDEQGMDILVSQTTAMVGLNKLIIGSDATGHNDDVVWVHDESLPFNYWENLDLGETRIIVVRIRNDLGPAETSRQLQRLALEVVAVDDIGEGADRDLRVWIRAKGQRDMVDIFNELSSAEFDAVGFYEDAINPESNLVPELRSDVLPKLFPSRRRGARNAGQSRAEVYAEAARAMQERYIQQVLPQVFGTAENPGDGRVYYMVDARVDDDNYSFDSLEGALVNKIRTALNATKPYDDVRETAPPYRHSTSAGPTYQVKRYEFLGWDQRRTGTISTPAAGEPVNRRDVRFEFAQSTVAGISEILEPRHKGIIFVLHGYNNSTTVDPNEQPGQLVLPKTGRMWNPSQAFYGRHLVTSFFPQIRYLYRQRLAAAPVGDNDPPVNPDDYLILPIAWTGDYNGGLHPALFLNQDSAFAHDTAQRVLRFLIEDIVAIRDSEGYESSANQGNGQLDEPFDIILQGNSLGNRVLVSLAEELEERYPLERVAGSMEVRSLAGAFKYPHIRTILGHPALRSEDFADAHIDLKQDNGGAGAGDTSQMRWPQSPLQAELRGTRFGGHRPLLFYSPFDKPGLVFKRAQRIPGGPKIEMAGRVSVPAAGYANTPAASLVPIEAIHSGAIQSGGEPNYADLWHVVLFGWNLPGQRFASRHTYRHNAEGQWLIPTDALVGANLTSYGRISELQAGHMDPVWNKIAGYVLHGDPIP